MSEGRIDSWIWAIRLAKTDAIHRRRSDEPAGSPEQLLAFVLDALKTPEFDAETRAALLGYLRANVTTWTGNATQLQAKVPGLVHLVSGTPEYQFV